MVGVVQKLLNFKTQNVVKILLSEIICHCVKNTFYEDNWFGFSTTHLSARQMSPFV